MNYALKKYEDVIFTLYPDQMNDIESEFLGIKLPKINLGIGKAFKTYQENKTERVKARQAARTERTALRADAKAAKWGAKAQGAQSGFESLLEKASGLIPGAQSSTEQYDTSGTDVKTEEKSNTNTIIIVAVVLIVVGVAAYFLLKK